MQLYARFSWFFLISTYLVIATTAISCFAPGVTAEESKAMRPRDPANKGLDQWYPYIVPAGYIDPKTVSNDGPVHPFGHGLYLALVRDLNGLVGNITDNDLKEAHVTSKAAYTQAYINLEKLLQSNQIKMTVYPKGPNEKPFIVIGHHWCSAACIVLPGIYELAQRGLHCDQVAAIIPHRDVLLIFPMPDTAGLGKLREFAKKNEGDGRKPLTFEPFELTKTGPVPLQ